MPVAAKYAARVRRAGPLRVKDRTLTDMERFYYSLDLAAIWTDFYETVNRGGQRFYKSSRQLAVKLSKNDAQLEFLTYILGPNPGEPRLKILWTFAPDPLDFDAKRENGGWFTEANLEKHSKMVRQQINALDALRQVGNGIVIHSLARMENLAKQLDREFGGRFFGEGLSLKDNAARANLYLTLHQRLLSMIAQAQDVYAKSHGINFQDMSGFERLLAAQAMAINAAGGAGEHSRTERVLSRIVEMMLEKGQRHGMELPAGVEKVIAAVPSDAKKAVM